MKLNQRELNWFIIFEPAEALVKSKHIAEISKRTNQKVGMHDQKMICMIIVVSTSLNFYIEANPSLWLAVLPVILYDRPTPPPRGEGLSKPSPEPLLCVTASGITSKHAGEISKRTNCREWACMIKKWFTNDWRIHGETNSATVQD